MTARIDLSDGCDRHCFRSDHQLATEVNNARYKAHEKHGNNSIEGIPWDSPQFLSVLVEEVGEVAHALTYDSGATIEDLRGELIDVLAVASAWVDAIRCHEATLPTAPTEMTWDLVDHKAAAIIAWIRNLGGEAHYHDESIIGGRYVSPVIAVAGPDAPLHVQPGDTLVSNGWVSVLVSDDPSERNWRRLHVFTKRCGSEAQS